MNLQLNLTELRRIYSALAYREPNDPLTRKLWEALVAESGKKEKSK